MLTRQFVIPCILLTGMIVSGPVRTAHAGPLLDWLFHRPAYGPAVPVGAPYPVTAGYAPYGAGYAAGYAPAYAAAAPGLPTYSTGYTPYSTGYTPATAGYGAAYNPYSTGYTPYSTGYTPYGVAYPVTSAPVAAVPRYSAGYAPAQSSYPVPSYGTYYGASQPIVGANGYGYMSQKVPNDVISPAQAVMPPTAPVTLVPDYRSTSARTPVTYYRPVMSTDPSTGAQVVTLSPCSSYEYQTQRVPTWGLSQVYNGGATLPAVTPTAPVVSPTYSLPRGGIPLAGPMPGTQPYSTAYGTYPTTSSSIITPVNPTTGSIITPVSPSAGYSGAPYSSGYSSYSSNYGNYSTLQPPATMSPSGTYPTTPLSPYYGSGVTGSGSTGGGSTGGGSTGNYGVPGTFAPSNNVNPYPNPVYNNTPGVPAGPLSPGMVVPPTTPGNFSQPGTYPAPASQMPSLDPAAGVTPVLPPLSSGARIDSKPQLQNIVQQPMPAARQSTSVTAPATNESNKSQSTNSSDGLLPVPIPADFNREPRWNPGLMKEQDTTASLKSVDPQVAWGSKPIRWASLKQPSTRASEPPMPPPQPSRMRDKIRQPDPPVMVDIPEVNFPAPVPARLEIEDPIADAPAPVRAPAPAAAPIAPNGRRTDIWQAVK